MAPHPSAIIPQSALSASHDLGAHAHLMGEPPPPQTLGGAHMPQCRGWPQPSCVSPQSSPKRAHVFGTHSPMPHWLALSAPHTSSSLHIPHINVFPHPSGMDP